MTPQETENFQALVAVTHKLTEVVTQVSTKLMALEIYLSERPGFDSAALEKIRHEIEKDGISAMLRRAKHDPLLKALADLKGPKH